MSDILNCGDARQEQELVRFTYRCRQLWRTMRVTTDKTVRFCNSCQENVYYCTDQQEAERHALQGHCIAINRRLSGALYNRYTPMLKGRPDTMGKWGKDLFDRAKHQPIEAQNPESETVEHKREADPTDLTRADLSYSDLAGVDLSNFNLTHANLSHANLTEANLNGANLSHANLSGVSLSKNFHALGDRISSINLNGTILDSAEKISYLTLLAKSSKDRQKAVECLEQALTLQQAAEDCRSQAETLINLGDTYEIEPQRALKGSVAKTGDKLVVRFKYK